MSTGETGWPSFEVALGRRLREARTARGLTSAEVAERSRELGLRWDRSAVGKIETGDRPVSVIELYILAMITRQPVVELVPHEACWLTESVTAHEGALPANMAGLAGGLDPVGLRSALTEAKAGVERADARVLATERRVAMSRTEAVTKVARRLEADPWMVATAADRLWGHTLEIERDQRTGVVEGEAMRARQARRGHVTRTLVEELRPAVEELARDYPADELGAEAFR